MIRNNCQWCGRQVLEGEFCEKRCQERQAKLLAKPFKSFNSYSQASLYLGKDVRTIRRYEGVLFAIDKSIPNLQSKLKACEVCSQTFKTHENRAGYCPDCSKAGAGRKAQASCISQKYQGKGNPNYVDGKTKQTFRHRRVGKDWSSAVIDRDQACRCCEAIETLQAHHVIPVALFPTYALDVKNGITLCGHHTELHRSQLDLLLLPILYESLWDAQPLHEVLCLQPEFQALRQRPVQPFQKRQLLRVVPKNYHRQILRLHPEFAQQVFGLVE